MTTLWKRLTDIIISGLALIILSPVFMVVALALYVQGGSALIFQKRGFILHDIAISLSAVGIILIAIIIVIGIIIWTVIIKFVRRLVTALLLLLTLT